MKTDNIITLAGFGDAQLSATDAARRERDALLGIASAIATVASKEDAESAANALRDLKGFTRQIEDARKAVKEPVLDLTKRIDGLARELTSELESEASRIGKTLGAWQAEERRKEEDAQRKAREEEQRIWRDAQEKERLERERLEKVESDRQAVIKAENDALLAKAAATKNAAARKKLEEEAETRRIQEQIEADERQVLAQQQSEQRREEAAHEMVAARVAGAQVVAVKPAGVATREEIMFEVTDVVELYGAAPYLVTLEPNRAAIKSALKNLRPDQTLPGIKWWREAKTHVR